jgi:hypothetical protein
LPIDENLNRCGRDVATTQGSTVQPSFSCGCV